MASGNLRPGESILLPRWLRWSIYAITSILVVTGILWLAVRYGMRPPGEDDLPHPAEPWILRVHGLAMMVALFAYGTLLRSHIVNAWKLRRNRITGTAVATVMLALTVTGYMLYYVAGEAVRQVISVVHWAIGLGVVALLPLHVWSGRRDSKARR